jgi:hypothetical protein
MYLVELLESIFLKENLWYFFMEIFFFIKMNEKKLKKNYFNKIEKILDKLMDEVLEIG